MNRSSEYGFYLPQNTDPISVNDFNYNFDVIDDNMLSKNEQTLTSAQKSQVKSNLGFAYQTDLDALNSKITKVATYTDSFSAYTEQERVVTITPTQLELTGNITVLSTFCNLNTDGTKVSISCSNYIPGTGIKLHILNASASTTVSCTVGLLYFAN